MLSYCEPGADGLVRCLSSALKACYHLGTYRPSLSPVSASVTSLGESLSVPQDRRSHLSSISQIYNGKQKREDY